MRHRSVAWTLANTFSLGTLSVDTGNSANIFDTAGWPISHNSHISRDLFFLCQKCTKPSILGHQINIREAL
ncbi:hypothetical protein EDD18DRAFT_685476 [Armillaria luteobubalina]|uniref:Uncharacterized protein n=1 Tax=Armillaria luteobubalina TaxID=153913 RepID=A0AA39QH86_9AGAR|nr:hypothetical protein EDD18DRAFT_685476 [Armillaria luteobubalina]